MTRIVQRGLTLVELMIVLAVLAILVGVAAPLYTDQVRKARRADGRNALLQIAQAEERFFTVNGSYTNNLGNLTSLPASIQGGDSESGYYTVAVATPSATQFTVTATPAAGTSQAEDDYCTAMTLNHLGVRTGSFQAPATEQKCW